ncbi:hypothetical protein [Oceaniglobus roseus]|uniref:hypothetical protein n=1 Tax=Oceaniglobus roseus TaxID=1737570 RepID=UPI000C7EC526|nr:hypothetical protein [Kandeliimicrobium roseum]
MRLHTTILVSLVVSTAVTIAYSYVEQIARYDDASEAAAVCAHQNGRLVLVHGGRWVCLDRRALIPNPAKL